MGKMIDADLLKEKVLEMFGDIPMIVSENREELFSDVINDMPDAEREKWIPCSERLPEDLNDKNIDCFLVTDGFLIWMAYYNSEIGWQFAECTNSRNKIDWTEIIAWQPLPEPYVE